MNESSFTKISGGWIWPTGSSLFTPGIPPWESAPVGIPDVGQCPGQVNSVTHPSSLFYLKPGFPHGHKTAANNDNWTLCFLIQVKRGKPVLIKDHKSSHCV